MTPQDVRQLLGGYASGTLSDAEKKMLFEAALEDQVLFDAMADEQALKDLLDDPASRGYLQAVLDEPPVRPDWQQDPLRRREAMAPHSPAAPAMALSASKMEAPAPPPPQPLPPRRPPLWWGLLAAAALACVSVVGIVRLLDKPPASQMAQVRKEINPASAPPVAALPPAAAPRPSVSGPTRKADAPAAAALPQPQASPPIVEDRKAKQAEAAPAEPAKPREEISVQAQTPVVQVVPLPAPAPAVPVRQAFSPSQQPPASPQAAPDQLTTQVSRRIGGTAGARQLYFAEAPLPEPQAEADKAEAAASKAASGAAPSAASSPKDSLRVQKRAAAIAPGAAGAALSGNGLLPSRKAAFAMRYRILRKSGDDYFPVAPGGRFRLGDEIILVVEKNAGGTAALGRVGDTTTAMVPLAMQSPQLARTVPITIRGPLDLTLVLNPAGTSPLGLIPRQPASQVSEVADGMVYVAEPLSAASAQSLVIQIPIRLE